MTDRYILDIGRPVPCPDLFMWAKWIENLDNRRTALTKVGPFRVSTVFLGVDHSFGEGPPLLWETMVFEDGDGSEMDGYTRRYATETEAIAGHREVVSMLEEELKE